MLWSDSTQFNGDTIRIDIKESKIDQINIMQNAMVVLTEDEYYYDQISGKLLTTSFSEGKADNVLVTGNAQTVYYIKDEGGAYTGVNVKKSGSMRIWFEENKVQKVRFFSNPDGKFMPMGQTNHEELKLDGFSWRMDIRPDDIKKLSHLNWINWDELLLKEDIEDGSSESPPEDSEPLK
jgi:hypothetical protein